MQKFNKHIVRHNETLKSIASQYNISVGTLKLFHNNHCDVKDMILIGLTNQKELFIPRTAVVDKTQLVDFSNGNKIVFKPQNWVANYGVIIKIEKENRKNELKYKTSVRWLKSEKNLHYFEIDRISNLFINEEEVNEMADLLAYKTSQILYPLQISVDENGKLNGIENPEDFKKRWNTVKENVYKEYEGETVDSYCQKIENILNKPEALFIYLKNDYFLRSLFFGIYLKFNKDYKTEITAGFPIIKNKVEPEYKLNVEIDPLKNEHYLINISAKGILNEERSIYDLINGLQFPMVFNENPKMNHEGKCRFQYYLNGKTMLPESLYMEFEIFLENIKKVSVMVSELNNDDHKTILN
jgi:hypothetical protein